MPKPDHLSGIITYADSVEFITNPVVHHPGENLTVRPTVHSKRPILRGMVALEERPTDLTRRLMQCMSTREQIVTISLMKAIRGQADERILDEMVPPTGNHLQSWYRPMPKVSVEEGQALGLHAVLTELGRAMLADDVDMGVVDEAYRAFALAQGVAPTAADTLFMEPVSPDATVFMAPVICPDSESNMPGSLQAILPSDATQRFLPVGAHDTTMKFKAVQPQE